MISSDEEQYILSKAYVPEHIVGLMTSISEAEAFFMDGFIYYVKDRWASVVGYPLAEEFSLPHFEEFLRALMRSVSCTTWWIIAPQLPETFVRASTEKEFDEYYTISLDDFTVKKGLQKKVEEARKKIQFERSQKFTQEHKRLVEEFIGRETFNDRVKELYMSMPRYMGHNRTALTLNARAEDGRLIAFYILELGAEQFAAYIIGCHSKRHYIPHASDLLFYEMLHIAKEEGKDSVNLGLGVNSGIRRFKKKWGGIPSLSYQFCEYVPNRPGILSLIQSIESHL